MIRYAIFGTTFGAYWAAMAILWAYTTPIPQ